MTRLANRLDNLMRMGWRIYLKSDFDIPVIEIRHILSDCIVEEDEYYDQFVYVRDKKHWENK